MSQWFVQQMGQVVGPFSSAQLREKATSGEIVAETFVREGQTADWKTADSIEGIFPARPEKIPPSDRRRKCHPSKSPTPAPDAPAQSLAPLSFERQPPVAAMGTSRQALASQSVAPLSFEQPLATEHDTSRLPAKTEPVSPAPRSIAELPETFGRYRIVKKLGQGGMGAVYLAHDTQLDRQVALKVPRFSADERHDVVERFLREARAAATIHHPNLCPVYDVGQIDGIYYMTMAFIEGHLLSEYIRHDKPAPELQTAAIVRKLAMALQEAHARGVIHRDLKPTNIMINQRGEPVIMDFGLARRTQCHDVALTQSGSALGTPAYMAPEQARGQTESMGPTGDVYSLGVILYELLTSYRPFRGEMLQVLSQILTVEPDPPSKHRPDLAPRLEAICLQAISKRPEDRYATMGKFAAALTEYLLSAKEPSGQSRPEVPLASVPPVPPVPNGPGRGHAFELMGRDVVKRSMPQPKAATPIPSREIKQCPFCAEDILAAAIKCKHCGSDLTIGNAPTAFMHASPGPPTGVADGPGQVASHEFVDAEIVDGSGVRPPPPLPVQHAAEETGLAVCPVCQKVDCVQKVSTVVSAGQVSGTFSGPTGGFTDFGGRSGTISEHTTLSGTSVSHLAAKLIPPPLPSLESDIVSLLGGGVLFVVVLVVGG